MSGPDVRAIDLESLPEATFPVVDQGFRIHLAEEAFDRITARGTEEPEREVGGVLVGRAGRDEGGPFVLVETTIDALHADEQEAELTFTHQTWAHIHEEMDAHHPDACILGWYHTHPGFGVFLSERDTFIHRSFFDLPHQIAVVYDPKSREHGVFTWREGQPARAHRYWVGDRETTWLPGRGETDAEPTEGRAAPRKETDEGATPPLDRFSLAFGAIALLVLGGLIGWWLGGRGVAPDPARRQAEIQAAGLLGSQEMARRIEVDLVGVLRGMLTGATRRRLDAGLADLDGGLEGLAKGEATEEERAAALARIRSGLGAIRAVRTAEEGATRLLDLAAAAHQQVSNPRENRAVLTLHAAILGQVCADLADAMARAGDAAGARRILLLAVRVDPGRAEAYQRRIENLPAPEEEEKTEAPR